MYSQVKGLKIVYTFNLHRGSLPLFISIVHDGRDLVPVIEHKSTDSALGMVVTDCLMEELYVFAKGFSNSTIALLFSREVIDFSRLPDNACLYKQGD